MNGDAIKRTIAERDGLRCAVTGVQVSSVDELELDHIVPFSGGGTNDLSNLILVSPGANRAAGNMDPRSRILLDQLRARQNELAANEKATFEREQQYRQQIDEQKKELEQFRRKLQRDQAEREAEYTKELHEQRTRLRLQEAQLVDSMRMREVEIEDRLTQLEAERKKLHVEIQGKEENLKKAQDEFSKEKDRYTEEALKRVEKNASTYVNNALSALDTAANKHQRFSRNWSFGGVAALVFGIGVASYLCFFGLGDLSGIKSLEWPYVAFYAFKGLVLITLFVALAKYCFSYSQSFMHESLKSTERRHAINFGKFYLESYGVNADWGQIK
jgi:hypothetical protein